jgi:hypothetical protein
LAAQATLAYALRAPNRAKTGWVDIKIDHMTVADALFWDATVQKDILRNALDERAAGKPLSRPDAWWSWFGFRVLCPLSQLLRARRCRALTIFVRNDLGLGVPAAMLMLIEGYPWIFSGNSLNTSVFTWFLAAAPSESLLNLGVPDPPSLGRILIDTAIVSSLSLGLKGQMWLHAAPSGGAGLLSFYVKTCKLRALDQGRSLPTGKLSDGRHCYSYHNLATSLVNELKLTRMYYPSP